MLGLPSHIRACLFDLDGVLTQTASLHAAAWKTMFDAYLEQRSHVTGEPFVAFDGDDYNRYVDGKPRADGVASFLESRGIELPPGSDDDGPDLETVHGLGRRKNDLVQRLIAERGVEVFPGSIEYARACKAAGLPLAVVTSSANAHAVLEATGLLDLFDVVIDGVVASRDHLRGKPAPDTFLAGARALNTEAAAAAVFEDALAGVAAGRAGAFGYVVGVDRVGQAEALRAAGADIVVPDLATLMAAAQ